MTLKRFSQDYSTFGAWMNAMPRASKYAREIIRKHERFPTLSLNELRNLRISDHDLITVAWDSLSPSQRRERVRAAEVARGMRKGERLGSALIIFPAPSVGFIFQPPIVHRQFWSDLCWRMVSLRGCLLSALWVACLHLPIGQYQPGLSFLYPFLPDELCERVWDVIENFLFNFFHGDLLLCTKWCAQEKRGGLGI